METSRPPAPDPRAFPRDDRRIYDFYVAGRQSAALAVGVRLGLFDALAPGPRVAAELSASLDLRPRPFRSLVIALRAMRVLESDDGGETLRLAPDAAEYLVRGRPGWLGGLVDLEIEHFLSPQALLDALRKDDSSVYGDTDPWDAHEADPEQARRFTAAMHSVSERPAAGLAEAIDFSGVRSLLDVGGGSGALSIAIARAWPDTKCTVYDLPVVCPLAEEYARAAGLSDRVSTVAGDMFADAWPSGHDAILLSQILHDWPLDLGVDLLRRAHAALAPGGLLVVHEKLVDDDGLGPLANALVNLDMLVWTRGQQYSEAELRQSIRASGFAETSIQRVPTAGYWSAVLARKAS
ncbi:MAG: methyltransferase [bacterium]